ncbi:unnamed protein product [Periconia digitata]|uniref:tRNA(Phe) (4-demethylwyosine(37)-C(7)) aminocarboxypropyltransferase n=1 Tax=Periconia digitata TaxID=1303443 RepID=A0A9W4U2M4_9PLEO|nr:unnamed protein product [Periconia digitata]
MDGTHVALRVPRSLVKQVKTALEAQNLLNKSKRITTAINGADEKSTETYMTLYTSIPCVPDNEASTSTILGDLGLPTSISHSISTSTYIATTSGNTSKSSNNPLTNGLRNGLQILPIELLESLDLTIETLLSSFPDAYSIYKPLLLLPPNAFTSNPWNTLISAHPVTSQALQPVWNSLVTSTGTTHLALNAGIPLQKSASPPETSTSISNPPGSDNTFRSPLNLTPIYPPSFTPPPPTVNPTSLNFDSALWVSHTQNGIHQVWAPLYTMFSRGNVKEKARILSLPSVKSSVTNNLTGCTAVDLYAGIGYFAFSYRKAGVRKVLGWEVNAWSVEGFRRGAARNGWHTTVVAGDALPGTRENWRTWGRNFKDHDAVRGQKGDDVNVDFVVFQQSNEFALDAVAALQPSKFGKANSEEDEADVIPPVRHVNCGFLPSSELSWRTAVRVLDREHGGWIHAHENVGIGDIEKRSEEVAMEINGHVDAWEAERVGVERSVRCEHVEKVKTYAPGVMHVVFDVWVSGI